MQQRVLGAPTFDRCDKKPKGILDNDSTEQDVLETNAGKQLSQAATDV